MYGLFLFTKGFLQLIAAAATLFFIPAVQAIEYTVIIFLPVRLINYDFSATDLTIICIPLVSALFLFFNAF
jgi:hypothetical protein